MNLHQANSNMSTVGAVISDTLSFRIGGEVNLPRKNRVWYPGATYHVMSRGNRRTILFKDEDDYLTFVEEVQKAMIRFSFKIHSLCLMTNHFHMLLETSTTELSKIMQRILHTYAMIFNRKYHYTGHLFEDRYNDVIVKDERYFLEVSRYIHLNPVKAGMVREPLAYEYSSYRKFVTYQNDGPPESSLRETKASNLINEIVETDRVLGAFRHNKREQYRMFVESKVSHAEKEMLIQKDIKEDELWLPW